MNPEELQFEAQMLNKLFKKVTPVDDADVNNPVTESELPTFDFPDKWVQVELKGVLYRIPLYLESRFV